MGHTSEEVRRRFTQYCDKYGIEILRILQEGEEKNYVALVRDTDDVVKILKYVWQPKTNEIQAIYDGEYAMYQHLKERPISPYLPKYYGIEVLEEEGLESELFVRQSFLWGQSLAEYLQSSKKLSPQEVCCIISDIAEQLQWLHAHNIWHRDVRPENIHIHDSHAYLFDLDLAKIIPEATTEIKTRATDHYYAVPECVLHNIATNTSDVFQLGVLFHVLLYGTHPFVSDLATTHLEDVEEEVQMYEIANATNPYAKVDSEPTSFLIEKMVDKNPKRRASLDEIVIQLASLNPRRYISHRPRKVPRRENNIVLFPMRMGIPHKGHIEYLSRILELGYYVIISLQWSEIITDDDPIHKSIVMKIVARALMDRGFTKRHFHFIFTPYETEEEMKMHFAMMPHRENLVGIASGNPDVHNLFRGQRIFDQKSVFGIENTEWENRSWGKRLREAVKSGDTNTYLELIAEPSESVIALEELRLIYCTPYIPYVEGKSYIRLEDRRSAEISMFYVMRYISPEETIARKLGMEIYDLYARDTLLIQNDNLHVLTFLGISIEGKNKILHYKIAPHSF